MEQDASLRRYRDAFRAHPELNVRTPAGSADETVFAGGTDANAETAPHASPFPPHLEILEKIAETNLSTTWKVMDHERKSPVVLKEPRAHLLVDADALERFRREVHLASKLSHANIVPILATHLAEPPLFFTMPLIEGEHLDRYCNGHGLPLRARLALFLKVCRAVAYAHQQGVIHRDLKPNNVLVDKNGEPQLLDFGLGRVLETGERTAEAQRDVVMGSPGYMAPEQAAGLAGDTRTDVYALGVILYQLLTGELPIPPAQDLAELTRRIREDAPADPRHLVPGMDRDLAAIVLHALKKEPAQRYAGVADFARDVESYLAGKPVSAVHQTKAYLCARWLRRNWIGVSAAGVVIAGVLGFTVFAVRQSIKTARAEADAATVRATKDQEVAAVAEIGRHRMAVLYGRSQTRDGNPVSATAVLWQEQLRYDSVRTRYALWELYQQYPCRYAVGEYGRQLRACFSPDGQWLATVGTVSEDLEAGGPIRLFRADDGTVVAGLSATVAQAKCLCFAPDGRALLVGGADGRVRWFEFQTQSRTLLVDTPRDVTDLREPISSIALSADGTRLAAGTARGSIHVLSRDTFQSWQPAHVWQVPGEARGLAFSPDGQRLACAVMTLLDVRGSGGLMVRDLATDAQQTTLAGAGCRSVVWSEDGQWVFSGADSLAAWNPSTGELRMLGLAPWGLRAVAAPGHLAGRYAAAAAGDGRIWFHDLQQDAPCNIAGFHPCTADQIDVSFSPDGRRLASVGCDGLRVWDFLPTQSIKLMPAGDSTWRTREVAVSDDARLIVAAQALKTPARTPGAPTIDAGNTPGRIVVCGTSSWPAEPVVIQNSGRSLSRPCIAGDNRTVACAEADSASGQGRVLVCDALHPERTPLTARLSSDILALAWVEGTGRWLLIGVQDGALWAWRISRNSTETGDLEPVLRFPDACNFITSDPAGQWVAASSEGKIAPSQVVIWRAVEQGGPADNFGSAYTCLPAYIIREDGLKTWQLAFTRDSAGHVLLAASGADSDVHLFDALTGRPCFRLAGHTNSVTRLFTLGGPDATLLVTASRDRSVRIWDPHEAEEICRLGENGDFAVAARNGRIVLAQNESARVIDTREIAAYVERNRREAERRYGRGDQTGSAR